MERGLDPLNARLVVADASRTDKTICLAVSPALKAYGIGGRPRLFEVVREARRLGIDYIAAPPRMGLYIEVSRKINGIYLKYVAPEDMQIYSVDEVFIDATEYLRLYRTDAHTLAMRMIKDVLSQTGITATAGIGTNLYLAKIAMDIEAKHSPADADGVRIAELDEMSYRRKYWTHQPLTDFWRIGRGTAARLGSVGIYTLGDIARWSLDPVREDRLYKLFGVNAELLIDHAWGWEPCTMADIRSYRPESSSTSSGQVLTRPYSNSEARTVLLEMADKLALDLVERGSVTDQITLFINYDPKSLEQQRYSGSVVSDYYGRAVPKPAHGSSRLGRFTSSTSLIANAVGSLYDRITDKRLLVRRITISASHLVPENSEGLVTGDLFDNPEEALRERRRQEAILDIRRKFGNNAILKGMDFEEGATAIERNKQIGGHKA